jgi:hemerythrin superfamily protein
MNAIELLVTQHRRMEAALKSLLEIDGDRRARLFGETADELISHVLIEEEHFYPAVRARRTEDILLESLEEHLSLKRLVADLVALSADDPRFEPKVHVLKEQAEHHHREEEEKLFPKVAKMLSAEELDALGASMASAQAALLVGHPRERAVAQAADAAPPK